MLSATLWVSSIEQQVQSTDQLLIENSSGRDIAAALLLRRTKP